MFAIKYTLIIAVLIAVTCTQATVVQVQDVHIKITPEHFHCDRISCPANADRCVVTKDTLPHDLSTVLRSNICYSKSNVVLKKSLTYESIKNKNPIKELIDVHRHGGVNILSSNNFDEKKFHEDIAKFEKDMSHSMRKLNKDMNKMEHDLEHMFR